MKIERDEDRPGKWKVDVTIARRRIREHGFATRKAVEEFVAELKIQAKRAKFGLERGRPSVTVAELVEKHGDEIGQSRPRGRQVKKILSSFAASLAQDLSVDELTTADVRNWIEKLRRTGLSRGPLSGAGCNRYLSEISAMFRAAPVLFSELEDWSPPRIPWRKESRRGRERVISTEERDLLLEHLRFPKARADGKRLGAKDIVSRRDVADCFELALLTGMRGGEVRALEWSEIDLDAGEIHLPGRKTKTKTPRVVLLSGRALEILRRRLKLRAQKQTIKGAPLHFRSRWVFPNERGDGPRKEISRIIRPLARELGLRYGRNLPDGFSPHDTRHTATSEMFRAGFDLKTIQDVVGHSDRVMTLRYAHSTRESRRAAVESLAVVKSKRGR